MIAPCCRMAIAHSEDVLDYVEDGCVVVAPDVLEGSDVDKPFHRKFTQEKVE